MQFLSNIIKGILGFITGFFKPKANKDFFMEYEGDSADAQKAGTAATPAPAVAVSEAAAQAPAPGSKSKTFRGAAPAAPTPVAAATAASLNLPAPTVTFADVAMNPASGSTTSRRRPGANMTGFLGMARQVTPSR